MTTAHPRPDDHVHPTNTVNHAEAAVSDATFNCSRHCFGFPRVQHQGQPGYSSLLLWPAVDPAVFLHELCPFSPPVIFIPDTRIASTPSYLLDPPFRLGAQHLPSAHRMIQP
ncbi:hypothetical protein VKT23_010864 [Stygiomarasmius scandens]|uniref:Uncharacterized protein n=1 Tax=Marasmiellus scandens TaxID=2682957 RepID=A0ABR1JAF2_9AGAR